jgi:CRP/FNR family transcriptional regulator
MERIATTLTERFEAMQGFSFFAGLDGAILAEIAEGMRLAGYETGEVLFWDHEPCAGLYVVKTGSVKLYKVSARGREFILATFGPGATFNEVSVFDGENNPVNVAAIESAQAWIIRPEVIRKGIAQHPELARLMIANLSRNLRRMLSIIEGLSFYQVTSRLARLIEQLPAERLSGPASQRLTQDEIAARLGTVREVVGRSLRELQSCGAIRVTRGRIHVLDPAMLESWAQDSFGN